MRLSIVLALFLAPVTLAAQTSTGNSSAVFTLPPVAHSCPVRLAVDRVPQGSVLWTKNVPEAHGQGLSLSFAHSEQQIVSADITVHGYPATFMAIPAASSAGSDVTETFHLTAATAGQPLLSSSVWTKSMTAVSWVELTKLTYANGTTWQPSARAQCTAAPSLYLPVDATASAR